MNILIQDPGLCLALTTLIPITAKSCQTPASKHFSLNCQRNKKLYSGTAAYTWRQGQKGTVSNRARHTRPSARTYQVMIERKTSLGKRCTFLHLFNGLSRYGRTQRYKKRILFFISTMFRQSHRSIKHPKDRSKQNVLQAAF